MNTTAKIVISLLAMLLPVCAQEKDDVVMKAMNDELSRTVNQLHVPDLQKPYFISYRVDDLNSATVSATLGSITQSNPLRTRIIGVEVRVGDYAFDNTNYVSAQSFGGGGMSAGVVQGPIDDDYQQVRRQLWIATDAQYKHVAEEYSAKKAALANRKRTTDVADFSKEQPATVHESRSDAKVDIAALEQLAREVSLPFKQMPTVVTSSVQIDFKNLYTRYVNSEGSTFTRSDPEYSLRIDADTQGADGLPIHDTLQIFGDSLSDFPPKTDLIAKAKDMGQRLEKLRAASAAEQYNGPVLFESEAAAEVFAQVFAPKLASSRVPDSDDPRFQVFMKQMMNQMGLGGGLLDRIGGRVLPEWMDLADDPRMKDYQGTKLAGYYEIDDDAVPSHATKLVEKGVLKTLLASRVPVRTILHSTGSRRSLGAVPSNLILTSAKTSTDTELKTELLRRVKERGLDYGIIIRRTGGGANPAMRAAAMMAASPQSAPTNTLLEVYKIFPDGHEELIKGAELSGLTSATFRDIVAAGDKPAVLNQQVIPNINAIFTMGMAGGIDMPVASFVVPSLLFEEISLTNAEGPFPAPPASKPPLAGN
jgi:predicted Zn-dependent protease